MRKYNDTKKQYQTMVFSIDQYRYGVTYDKAKEEMWKDIGTFLQLLVKNENVAVIRQEETDIIIIEYEHDENVDSWGCANPQWVTESEYYEMIDSKDE